MKICPECGTEYEDHVPLCLADGVELVAVVAPVAPPPASATPAPAPPPPARSGTPFLLLLIPLFLIGVVVVAGIAVVAMSSGGTPAPEPVPVPVPVPLPAPPPPPPAPDPVPVTRDVAFVTIPEGAELFENDQLVCVAPCTVPHPEHAPLPRKFVAKAPGYRDTTFDMEAAEGPYLIELQKIRTAAPRPAPPPRPTAPAPGPQLPRPSIGRDRGKDGE